MSRRLGRPSGVGRWAAAAAALAALAALAGCGPQDGLAAAGTPVPTSSGATTPAGPPTGTAATAPAVTGAALDPCPTSDPTVEARDDGLPDLTLPCLGEGPAVRLAGLRGLPTVVNVWASWCPPCLGELPAMARVSAAAGDRVRFLGIDLEDQPKAALAVAGAAGVRFPSVSDPEGRVRAALRPPLVGPPRTYFVRADGSVAARVDGAIDDPARLRELIRTHLGVTV